MHKAVVIHIWIGFLWVEYLTTNADEATNFQKWMEDRGHEVFVQNKLREVEHEIPSIERVNQY